MTSRKLPRAILLAGVLLLTAVIIVLVGFHYSGVLNPQGEAGPVPIARTKDDVRQGGLATHTRPQEDGRQREQINRAAGQTAFLVLDVYDRDGNLVQPHSYRVTMTRVWSPVPKGGSRSTPRSTQNTIWKGSPAAIP